METNRAKEIITLRDREKARQSNFRSLWQSTADLIFPQTFGISNTVSVGSELMSGLFDTTAVEEAENMASGLVSNLFPAGQRFFTIGAPGQLRDNAEVKEYLPYLTEQVHEQMFNSNFIAQVSNTIHYWVVFGTGAIYSDWTRKDGLNYRDYAIGTYQCLENAQGIIDTIILTCPMSARQIVEKFGNDESKVGKSVWDAYQKAESRENTFDVIQLVGPRENYDPNPFLRPATSAPFESFYVQEKDSKLLQEGGYDEFPFAVPRYQVIYREVMGRGRGTTMLPQVRTLNRLAKDYLEMSNKWVNPPKEVLESFEGTVDVTPGALNYVAEINSIRAIEMGSSGAYPVTKDILEYRREGIRQGFFKNAFEALTNLTGDRRTTTEIIERLKEGMKRLSKPMGRLFTELLTPDTVRTIRLLVRNGVVERPPDVLAGAPLKIEFINPLALALKDQQARGGQYWISALMNVNEQIPGVLDNADTDEWARDLGESLGVKSTQIRTIRKRDEIRRQRDQDKQMMQEAGMAAAAAEGYSKVTKAPEPGSPLSGEQE